MQRFNHQNFLEFVVNNDVVGFFKESIKLKSGRQSHWYVNWRTVSADAFLTDKLSDFLIDFISDLKLHPDCIFGVPEGATKLAIIASYKWARQQPNYDQGSHVLSLGRGKPKEHGASKDKYFVGEPRGRVVILEDVTTTGQSLCDTVKSVQETGATVVAAVSLTDRMELTADRKTVTQVVAECGVEYHAMSKATELLPEACRRYKPDAKIIGAIEEEFKQFGYHPLKLENP